MNKDVKVTANETGVVINISKKNPEYGYVRVTQERNSFDGGWMKKRTLSALISGKVEELKDFGFTKDQVLPGKIVVLEDIKPFQAENPDKDVKLAGDTGIICSIGGEPIYRRTIFTDNLDATDSLLEHDNTEEIQHAYAEAQAEKAESVDNIEAADL